MFQSIILSLSLLLLSIIHPSKFIPPTPAQIVLHHLNSLIAFSVLNKQALVSGIRRPALAPCDMPSRALSFSQLTRCAS